MRSFVLLQPNRNLKAYYAFRWQILREPWNQPPGSEKDEFESRAIHLAAWDDAGRLIGIGRLHRVAENYGQVRYMAVEPTLRSSRRWNSLSCENWKLRAIESGIQEIKTELTPGCSAILPEKWLSNPKTFAYPLWHNSAFRNVEEIALNLRTDRLTAGYTDFAD